MKSLIAKIEESARKQLVLPPLSKPAEELPRYKRFLKVETHRLQILHRGGAGGIGRTGLTAPIVARARRLEHDGAELGGGSGGLGGGGRRAPRVGRNGCLPEEGLLRHAVLAGGEHVDAGADEHARGEVTGRLRWYVLELPGDDVDRVGEGGVFE
jgi:hypothetical protein